MRLDRLPTDRVDVLDRCDEPRQQFVRERPGLEAMPERLVGGRANLVRPPASEKRRFRVCEAQVRAVELVGRADQDVGSGRSNVDRSVGRVVDGVDPGERADFVRELGHPGHVYEGADRIRRPGKGDDARPVAELRGEVVEVERRVLTDVREADDQAQVVCQLQPR